MMCNSYIQMVRQHIVDVVIIGGRFNDDFSTSVLLGKVIEVRVGDATSSVISPASSIIAPVRAAREH